MRTEVKYGDIKHGSEREDEDFFLTNRESFKEALAKSTNTENLFTQVFPDLDHYGVKWSEVLRTVKLFISIFLFFRIFLFTRFYQKNS
jgi:hypothetical protein